MAGNDGLFPVEQLAALLMVTPRRLQQLANDGWFDRPAHGRYHLVKTVQGYVRYLKDGTRDQNRGNEQARLARAQAIKVEMQNFERMGELNVRAQTEETEQGLVILIKSLHEGLPGRLASEFSGISDAGEIYKRLQTELRAVLNLCADYLEKRAATLETMPEPSFDHQAERPRDAGEVGEQEPDDAG